MKKQTAIILAATALLMASFLIVGYLLQRTKAYLTWHPVRPSQLGLAPSECLQKVEPQLGRGMVTSLAFMPTTPNTLPRSVEVNGEWWTGGSDDFVIGLLTPNRDADLTAFPAGTSAALTPGQLQSNDTGILLPGADNLRARVFLTPADVITLRSNSGDAYLQRLLDELRQLGWQPDVSTPGRVFDVPREKVFTSDP